jgi:hypothetical protein
MSRTICKCITDRYTGSVNASECPILDHTSREPVLPYKCACDTGYLCQGCAKLGDIPYRNRTEM